MSPPEQQPDFAGPFMDDYFAECEDHLAAVRRGLLLLESGIGGSAPPAATLEELFRSFHSLKGLSAMVELREAERLSHEMESCLRAIRQREIQLSTAVFDALIDGVQLLELVIAARRSQSAVPLLTHAGLTGGSEPNLRCHGAHTHPSQAPTPPAGPLRAGCGMTFTPSPDLVARRKSRSDPRRLSDRQIQTSRCASRTVPCRPIFTIAEDGLAFEAWQATASSRADCEARIGCGAVSLPLSCSSARAEAPAAPTNIVRVDPPAWMI